MFKILYVGLSELADTESVSQRISDMSAFEIAFTTENSIESATEHFFDPDNQVILLIMEEIIEGLDEFIEEIKRDESFQYLPIMIILDHDTKTRRKTFYGKGIEGFLKKNFDCEELLLACNSAIKNKIRLDQVLKDLGDTQEKNITKAIQLELIKRFIPCTVWKKTLLLAEDQDFNIPEMEQDLAIMFADLQSFTAISEKMKPKEVVDFLNGVFDIATRVIYQNHGDIDKFIGDALLAVFERPEMALLSSIEIIDELNEYNIQRQKDNLPATTFRIGINYGKVIRGSVGGNERFDNTLIGDPINTAQRLEGLSPPGTVLAAKSLLDQFPGLINSDIVYHDYSLKGKDKTVKAALVYDYYLSHRDLLPGLRKIRQVIGSVECN
jgi:adenylate cyclase